MYHKVDLVAPTRWWVRAEVFARQMAALERFRPVYLDDYDPADPTHVVITFDDAYENLLRHAVPVLARHGYPFEVFACGALAGKWNLFDRNKEPMTRIASIEGLQEMAAAGGRIQWHTRSHPDLSTVDFATTLREMTVNHPYRKLFGEPHLRWFSYPYGATSPAAETIARTVFRGAVAVEDGDVTDRFRLPRVVADEDLDPATLSPVPAPRVPWRSPAARLAAKERAATRFQHEVAQLVDRLSAGPEKGKG